MVISGYYFASYSIFFALSLQDDLYIHFKSKLPFMHLNMNNFRGSVHPQNRTMTGGGEIRICPQQIEEPTRRVKDMPVSMSQMQANCAPTS